MLRDLSRGSAMADNRRSFSANGRAEPGLREAAGSSRVHPSDVRLSHRPSRCTDASDPEEPPSQTYRQCLAVDSQQVIH